MQTNALASVIPLEAKTTFIKLGDLPLEVIVEEIFYQDKADCVDVKCIYPTNYVKIHQLFLKDNMEALLEFMIRAFKGAFNENVVPVEPTPKLKDLVGCIIKFNKG